MAVDERSAVVGVFEHRDQAHRALQELRRAGFQDDQIGFALRGSGAAQGATTVYDSAAESSVATGAVTGGVVGSILGALAAGLIPGIGPVLAGGILVGVIGGGLVGAVAGGLLGALVGMGVPEDEAHFYDEEFQAGRTIVTVNAVGRYQEAQAILRRLGAYDVETRDEPTARPPLVAQSGEQDSAPAPAARLDRVGESAVATEQTVELREEELLPHRQVVEAGEVRLGKEVVSEPRSIRVPVKREVIEIEHRPVERRPAERPISTGDTIEIPVREEPI